MREGIDLINSNQLASPAASPLYLSRHIRCHIDPDTIARGTFIANTSDNTMNALSLIDKVENNVKLDRLQYQHTLSENHSNSALQSTKLTARECSSDGKFRATETRLLSTVVDEVQKKNDFELSHIPAVLCTISERRSPTTIPSLTCVSDLGPRNGHLSLCDGVIDFGYCCRTGANSKKLSDEVRSEERDVVLGEMGALSVSTDFSDDSSGSMFQDSLLNDEFSFSECMSTVDYVSTTENNDRYVDDGCDADDDDELMKADCEIRESKRITKDEGGMTMMMSNEDDDGIGEYSSHIGEDEEIKTITYSDRNEEGDDEDMAELDAVFGNATLRSRSSPRKDSLSSSDAECTDLTSIESVRDEQFDDSVSTSTSTRSRSCLIKSCLKDPLAHVTFADDCGLKLENVRYLTPPNDYLSPLMTSSTSEKLQMMFRKIHPTKTLTALFAQPNTCTSFVQNVLDRIVMLEYAHTNCQSLYGSVRVKNISYEKKILVRYTIDDWKTDNDLQATYSHHHSDSDTDSFSFYYSFSLWASRLQKLEFAVFYRGPDGHEIWDNNMGKNYQLVYRYM